LASGYIKIIIIFPIKLSREMGKMELTLIILIILLTISLILITIYLLAIKLLYNTTVLTAKIKKIKPFIYPIIIILSISIIWKSTLPENYYSLKRLFGSNEKLINKKIDKDSFRNEVDAIVTYARLRKDINVLYTAKIDNTDNIVELNEVLIKLKANSLVKMLQVAQPIKSFQSQGFTQIQIQNQNGTYVNGACYWIEADFIDILNPNETESKTETETTNKINKSIRDNIENQSVNNIVENKKTNEVVTPQKKENTPDINIKLSLENTDVKPAKIITRENNTDDPSIKTDKNFTYSGNGRVLVCLYEIDDIAECKVNDMSVLKNSYLKGEKWADVTPYLTKHKNVIQLIGTNYPGCCYFSFGAKIKINDDLVWEDKKWLETSEQGIFYDKKIGIICTDK
jgi:hypothetical protein